ncbi:MAG: hypothetical protein QM811_06025 [Pirellulales bacterium]
MLVQPTLAQGASIAETWGVLVFDTGYANAQYEARLQHSNIGLLTDMGDFLSGATV